MRQQEYNHHTEIIFDVGDQVFLQLQTYKQMSLNKSKKDAYGTLFQGNQVEELDCPVHDKLLYHFGKLRIT